MGGASECCGAPAGADGMDVAALGAGCSRRERPRWLAIVTPSMLRIRRAATLPTATTPRKADSRDGAARRAWRSSRTMLYGELRYHRRRGSAGHQAAGYVRGDARCCCGSFSKVAFPGAAGGMGDRTEGADGSLDLAEAKEWGEATCTRISFRRRCCWTFRGVGDGLAAHRRRVLRGRARSGCRRRWSACADVVCRREAVVDSAWSGMNVWVRLAGAARRVASSLAVARGSAGVSCLPGRDVRGGAAGGIDAAVELRGAYGGEDLGGAGDFGAGSPG